MIETADDMNRTEDTNDRNKKRNKPVTLKLRPVETKTEIDERGAFQRQPNRFTTPFGDGLDDLKAEKGRYRLFWARGCHWSNRASIVRELLGT